MSAPVQVENALETGSGEAVRRAAAHLEGLQAGDGHWCAELTADTTLESDYISSSCGSIRPKTANGSRRPGGSSTKRRAPFSTGNWPMAASTSTSRAIGGERVGEGLCGAEAGGSAGGDARMARLRRRILELGGIQAANSYVKVNLSLFDLYPRQYCPSIPPEVVLLPFHFLYQMSAWTRAIVVSLAIVHAANPRRPVPAGFTWTRSGCRA